MINWNPQQVSLLALAMYLTIPPIGAMADEALRPRPLAADVSLPALLLAAASNDDFLSKDALFGGDADDGAASPGKKGGGVPAAKGGIGMGVKGYAQLELARTLPEPAHWSKMRLRADLSKTGRLSERVKFKLGARFDLDGAFDQSSEHYSAEVRRDGRTDVQLRENYLDINAGSGLDFRLGRQHVVWGEMVGLYFADVVSARDFREFILPDFESQRIPQWAARAEYFGDALHAELLWIPVPSFDRVGKPGRPVSGQAGSDFFPYQPDLPGLATAYLGDDRPDRDSSNTNYGARLSGLIGGWDLSAFAYRSLDVAPTFVRSIDFAGSTVFYQAKHDRINQIGGTLSKDFGSVVLKSEVVQTRGRRFPIPSQIADPDGLAPSDTIDWAIGLDFTPFDDVRLNFQGFQRVFVDHDPAMLTKERESGYAINLANKLTDRFEVQLLWIASFDRGDWLARPKLIWYPAKNWRAQFGADVFQGPAAGLFGQYSANDRGYLDVRYSF